MALCLMATIWGLVTSGTFMCTYFNKLITYVIDTVLDT